MGNYRTLPYYGGKRGYGKSEFAVWEIVGFVILLQGSVSPYAAALPRIRQYPPLGINLIGLSPVRPVGLRSFLVPGLTLGLSCSRLAVLSLPLANTNIYSWVRK